MSVDLKTFEPIYKRYKDKEHVIDNLIKSFKKKKSKLSNIIVAIGPCISQKSYEVKKDFVSTIKKKNSDFKKYFNNNNNKIYFDLRMFVYNKFLKLGIPKKNIENINQDTYSNSKNFFSYRRSVHNNDADYGRCISVICRN